MLITVGKIHQRKPRPFFFYPDHPEGLEMIRLHQCHGCGCQPLGFGRITENEDFNLDVVLACAVLTLHKDVYRGSHLQDVGGRHDLPVGKYFQMLLWLPLQTIGDLLMVLDKVQF